MPAEPALTRRDPTLALRMEGISKRFGATLALDRVGLEVRAGEVHALMGENGAGKSTLVKVLAGAVADHEGRISIGGAEARLRSPADARAVGVGMVYQELSLARPISIAENLLAGRLPRRRSFFLDRSLLLAEARRRLARVGLELDPHLAVEEISQSEAQLVEIAKVLGAGPCILVLDEPTSALSREEASRLFEIVRRLRSHGLSIIYISHHLGEVFEIADRVTVLRDGRRVGVREISETTPGELVRLMTGRAVDELYRPREAPAGEIVFRVIDLTRWGFLHHVSLVARRGEIVGIGGLSGAGRTELARSISGLDPTDAGRVELEGSVVPRGSYPGALSRGIAYLSEDRKVDGIFGRLSIRENLLAATVARRSRAARSALWRRRGGGLAAELAGRLAVSAPSLEEEAANLSGGNQQKLLLGKALAVEPKVLILDEPTRGVDVGAKLAIHREVRELARRGTAVLLISSDLPELVGLSDRVLVMRAGRITGELSRREASEESVLLAASGPEAGDG